MAIASLTLLLVYLLIRVTHLVASAIWIFSHGQDWIADLHGASATQIRDPRFIDALFSRHEGGRFPLFFGVKSYRLRNWSRHLQNQGHVRRGALLRLTRSALWQYFAVPFWSAALIVMWSQTNLTVAGSRLLLACAATLLVGCLAVATESVFAALQMGSWAAWYHRIPATPKSTRQNMSSAELVFTGGTFLLLWLFAAVPFQMVGSAKFDTHGDRAGVSPVHQAGLALRDSTVGQTRLAEHTVAINDVGVVSDWACLVTLLAVSAAFLLVWNRVSAKPT